MTSKRSWQKRTPLYVQVAQHLRTEIQKNYESGQKLVAESRLASQLGVSLTTIREALSCLSQEGMLERRHGSGTYVLDPLGSRHVAILSDLDISQTRTSYFFLKSVQSLRAFFDEHQVKAHVYIGRARMGEEPPAELTCREFLEDVAAQKISGVIAEATQFRLSWMQPLIEQKIPVIGGTDQYAWSVKEDYHSMIRAGTEYLLDAGRRRIAFMATGGADSIQIFEEILQQRGLNVRSEWILSESQPGREGAGWDAFHRLWGASGAKPDGLIVTDDVLFQGVAMAVLEARVRVPDELLLAAHAVKGGYLHCPFPVAHLQFDLDALVRAKGEMMLRLLAHQEIPEPHVTLPFELVESGAHLAEVQPATPMRQRV